MSPSNPLKTPPSLQSLVLTQEWLGLVDVLPFSTDDALFHYLLDSQKVSEEGILSAWAAHTHLPFLTTDLFPDPALLKKIGPQAMRQGHFVPLFEDAKEIGIATSRPFWDFRPFLKDWAEKEIVIFLVESHRLREFWQDTMDTQTRSGHILNHLMEKAVSMSASDLHINCIKDGASAQIRVHGQLSFLEHLEGSAYRTLCALIKLHAHMDVSLFNRPQDGRLTFETAQKKTIDVRISSLPTVFGEDFVFRFFNAQVQRVGLESIGLSSSVLSTCKSLLQLESGLILVTGPTGSGKTTTLYSFLDHLLSQKDRMIVSLEDPVESVLSGVRQSQINPRSGYDFVTGLRAVLRQDPDCIMIGEIRDRETAATALDAAYTGHLVLSSLHTDHCLTTVGRLLSFDLDPFLLASCLKGILSQRLVPGLCAEASDPKDIQKRILLTELLVCHQPDLSTHSVKEADQAFSYFKHLTQTSSYHSFEDDLLIKRQKGLC